MDKADFSMEDLSLGFMASAWSRPFTTSRSTVMGLVSMKVAHTKLVDQRYLANLPRKDPERLKFLLMKHLDLRSRPRMADSRIFRGL